MIKGKKFFALAVCVFMFYSSMAFAVTNVTVTSSTPAPTGYINDDGVNPVFSINKNGAFNITFTANNPAGEIQWMLHYSILGEEANGNVDDGNLSLSSTTGNTVTLNGILASDKGYNVLVIAADSSSDNVNELVAQRNVWAYNSEYYNSFYQGNSNGNNPIPTPTNPGSGNNSTETTPERLHVATVEPIHEEYKTDDLLQKLADNANINRSDIQWLSADVINTAEPPEPTTKMRDTVKSDGYEFVAKLNTIKVSEDGYYAFMVTVSDDLVGTKVSDLKLYYAEPSDFLADMNGSVETAFGLMPLINGVTGGFEVSNFLGVKLDTLPKQFLATMFLSASKSMTVYIVKILLVLLGGCNVGFGIAGTFVAGVIAVKFFKTRK